MNIDLKPGMHKNSEAAIKVLRYKNSNFWGHINLEMWISSLKKHLDYIIIESAGIKSKSDSFYFEDILRIAVHTGNKTFSDSLLA